MAIDDTDHLSNVWTFRCIDDRKGINRVLRLSKQKNTRVQLNDRSIPITAVATVTVTAITLTLWLAIQGKVGV